MSLQALPPQDQENREIEAIKVDESIQKRLVDLDCRITDVYRSASLVDGVQYTVKADKLTFDVNIIYTHENELLGPATFRIEMDE